MQIAHDLLSIDDVARELQVTRRTLERWHALRMGPPRIKLGKQVFYRAPAVRDWLIKHEQAEVRS